MTESYCNNEDRVNKIHFVSRALQSLGALLEQQVPNPYFEKNELNGLGEILKHLSQDLYLVEKGIRDEEDK